MLKKNKEFQTVYLAWNSNFEEAPTILIFTILDFKKGKMKFERFELKLCLSPLKDLIFLIKVILNYFRFRHILKEIANSMHIYILS